MIEENALHGTEKKMDQKYQEMNGNKDYSFMIINKSAPRNERTKIVSPGGLVQKVVF